MSCQAEANFCSKGGAQRNDLDTVPTRGATASGILIEMPAWADRLLSTALHKRSCTSAGGVCRHPRARKWSSAVTARYCKYRRCGRCTWFYLRDLPKLDLKYTKLSFYPRSSFFAILCRAIVYDMLATTMTVITSKTNLYF